jgi:hypothetical protein
VFIKATEGVSYVNPRQDAQTAAARKAGVVVGFYHFAQPGNIQAQAKHFVEKARSVDGDILAIDWEHSGVSSADKDALIRAVKKLRPTHKVVLYCNSSYWLHRDSSSYCGDGLWIADYSHAAGHPPITHAWLFHQYSSTPVDKDVAQFATVAALRAWATGGTVHAPAEPTVDLSQLVHAAKSDPQAKQGHQTYKAGVHLVEAALLAEGLLDKRYASDGSYGTITKAAYAKWQKRAGVGQPYDGIPGIASLTKLGKKHGFKAVA